jgi:hypothetical protein
MMPTDKSMEKARKLLEDFFNSAKSDDEREALLAQFRDDAVAEHREALEELCCWGGKYGDCWCHHKPGPNTSHSPGCKLARALLEKP